MRRGQRERDRRVAPVRRGPLPAQTGVEELRRGQGRAPLRTGPECEGSCPHTQVQCVTARCAAARSGCLCGAVLRPHGGLPSKGTASPLELPLSSERPGRLGHQVTRAARGALAVQTAGPMTPNCRRRGLAPFEGGASPPSSSPLSLRGRGDKAVWSHRLRAGWLSPSKLGFAGTAHLVCRMLVATSARHRNAQGGLPSRGDVAARGD